jgi:hypothetical protein
MAEQGFTSGARPYAFTFFTPSSGLRAHLGRPGGLPRVLVPRFAFPQATVMVRYDTRGDWWAGRLTHHAGCTSADDWGDDHGVLGWSVMTSELGGEGSMVPSIRGGYATKQLRIAGRVVTRMTPRRVGASPEETIYRFRADGLLYQVNGKRPYLPRGTDEQHFAWIEQQIRTAGYAGR